VTATRPPLPSLTQVIIQHPGKQHVYQTVLAAQDAGMLQQFLTTFFWGKRDIVERVAHRISGTRSFEVRYLRRRWHSEIDAGLVTTFPYWHVVAKPAATAVGVVARGHGPDLSHWADVLFDRWASRWLRRQATPTIVHCFEGAALHSLRTSRSLGCQTVLDVPSAHEYLIQQYNIEGTHGRKLLPRRSWLRIAAERREADILLAPSPHVAQCLIENGIARDRIAVLPYGVDVDRFSGREKEHVPDQLFRVLYVGRASLGKGLRYLLQAWKSLNLPDAELTIAGGIDPSVRRLAHGSPPSVRWLGNVPFSSVHRLYKSSDAFVFPSLAEGSALVTYEAMASELPLVVTASAGSIVRDGIDGYVVPIRDPAAIAEKLEFLARHPTVRADLGRAARRRIIEGYSWQHYRRRLAAAYAALSAGKAVQPAIDQATSVTGAPEKS
jgi:glycosyltransferase involved in cell wall biosynthesis